MQLVKLIIPKRINKLDCFFSLGKYGFFALLAGVSFILCTPVQAQDNSPYSRYGIGDLVPPSHIINRGMGGLTAGYSDAFSINFSNPASYTSFQGIRETKSKKLVMGRAVLDLGVNLDSRTLIEPNPSRKFTASNAFFSYVQIGMPLKNNWGLSFGLRPVSRVSYNIISNEYLKNPAGDTISYASTNYTGNGGAYKLNLGTGIALFEKDRGDGLVDKLSVGVNANYYFGGKDYSTRRSLINDTISYYSANYESKTNFGSLYFDLGAQYKWVVDKEDKISMTVGASGAWGQKIKATRDILRETFQYDVNIGNVRLDSVSDQRDIKGKINIPGNYTVGVILSKLSVVNKEGGWLIGADYTRQFWSKYRFYGQKDSVQNSWLLSIGAQLSPIPKRNYWSNVSYRFGLFMGPDYIRLGNKLPQFGGSFGLGLPIALSRQAPNQVTLVNLAFEYGRRGNDDNLLKENLFRFSFGFSLSDFWFIKRKYD